MLAMFNNPKYSDIQIQLHEGVIYAHKVVLVCMSDVMSTMIDHANKENKNVLNFTDYTDETVLCVIRAAYDDKSIDYKNYDEWREILYLAHYLNYKDLMNTLEEDQRCSDFGTMIEIGSELNINRLFMDAADLAYNEIIREDDISSIVSQVLSLKWDDFKKLHKFWPNKTFIIFMLDCLYCDQHYIATNAYNHLSELIIDIQFNIFEHYELKVAQTFPILTGTVTGNFINCLRHVAEKHLPRMIVGKQTGLKKNIELFLNSNLHKQIIDDSHVLTENVLNLLI